MSRDDLREIFTYRETCISDTHDSLSCKRCNGLNTDGDKVKNENMDENEEHNKTVSEAEELKRCAQVGFPSEDQISLWGHHTRKEHIIDNILKDSDQNNHISFVFELRVPPMVLPM